MPQILDLNELVLNIAPIFQFLKTWLWVFLFFLFFYLFKKLLFLYKWWRNEIFNTTQKKILLEIKISKDTLKPIRAMENVLAGIWHTVYDPSSWWEKWIDGKFLLSFSLEIASIGGEPHFFIRIPEQIKNAVEAGIYAQYPEAEITVAEDYTKYVPQNIPNKDWDLWGTDYELLKEDSYPIKTYKDFETERETKEEKRIDPINSLLEALIKINAGEQLWIQINAKPITRTEIDWVKKGEEVRDKITKRPEKPKMKPIIHEMADIIITGETSSSSSQEENKEIIPPEMRLTPGERIVVSKIEEKISKIGFQTTIRFIYLGKKDVFFKPNLRLIFNFFANFTSLNLNGFKPWGETITKVQKSWFLPRNFFLPRRVYLKKRKMFRNYILRFPPRFPNSPGNGGFILNVEELASLYHFPGKTVGPLFPRVEIKKREPPPGLPVE